jgi:hypothetical protein
VNAGHAIGTWGTLVKHEWSGTFPDPDTFLKGFFLLPGIKDLLFEKRKVQLRIFAVFGLHKKIKCANVWIMAKEQHRVL